MKRQKASDAIARQVAAECIAVRIRLLTRVISGIYDQELEPVGITINQLNILIVVSQLSAATAKEVGRLLQMQPSTVSRNLERMRRNGWLRSLRGDDARQHDLHLTSKGSHVIETALPAWERAQKRAKALLGQEHTAALTLLADSVWSRSQLVMVT
jgi:DNA-binding MarR family transcriptional regulator